MDQHPFPPEPDKKSQAEPPAEDGPRTLTEWSPHWKGAGEGPGEGPAPARSSGFSAVYLPCGLFVATVVTTLWAGAYHVNVERVSGAWDLLVRYPGRLWDGWPFAATLLGILVTHEFGHFWLSRIHRVPASLPLFIPGPPQFIGTFGAIIRLRQNKIVQSFIDHFSVCLPHKEPTYMYSIPQIQRNTTPMYRSPEMIDLYSNSPVNEKADIWVSKQTGISAFI